MDQFISACKIAISDFVQLPNDPKERFKRRLVLPTFFDEKPFGQLVQGFSPFCDSIQSIE